MRAGKGLTRLRICEDSSELKQLTNAISTKIACAILNSNSLVYQRVHTMCYFPGARDFTGTVTKIAQQLTYVMDFFSHLTMYKLACAHIEDSDHTARSDQRL